MRVRETISNLLDDYVRPLVNAEVVREECRVEERKVLGYTLVCDADVRVKNPEDIAVAIRIVGDIIKEVMIYDPRGKKWVVLSPEPDPRSPD
jgi:hypothetical protein